MNSLRVSAALLLVIGAGFSTRVSAQEGTIEQLVATALERSPDLRAARTEVAAAEGRITQAALRPNPAFSATHMMMTGEQHQTLFEVEWPLDLFRRPARISTAQRAADTTMAAVQDRERLLAAAVRRQAGQLLAARRNVQIMTEALAAARRTRELLDSRVTEGSIPRLDANIAAVEAGRIEADLTLAQADVDGAEIELKALAGLRPAEPLTLRDSLEALVRMTPRAPAATTEAAAPTAEGSLAMRPDIHEAAARVAQADARIEQAQREGRMDVSLVGNYGYEHYSFAQNGFDASGRLVPVQGDFHSFEVGANFAFPIRNRNQGAIAEAQAARSGEQELLDARQLAAQAELDAAVVRDREARRAVEMYATSIRDLARQNVDVQLEAYDLGRTLLTELLAEQRRYLDVETGYTSVLSRAYDARVALRQARGEIR